MSADKALKVEDVLSFIGIEAEDIDGLKEQFNGRYVPKEEHSRTMGELNGKLSHAVKKVAKEVGIEFDASDFKDKPLTEVLPLFGERVKTKLTEIEGQKSATAEEIEKKFNERITGLTQKVTDLSQMNDTLKSEYEGFKTDVVTKEKTFKVSTHFDGAFGKLNFAETAGDYAKLGFKSAVASKYKFDLSDEGAPVVRDKDGNIVQSKAKAGTPATFDEVLANELKDAKLEKVVDSKKVGTFVPSSRVTEAKGGADAQPRRYQPSFIR